MNLVPLVPDIVVSDTNKDGRQWVPLYPHTNDLGAFVSLDPADWE